MNGQHPALVLNADYQPLSYFPLSTWSFEHTMKKVLRPDPAVVVVEEYDTILRSERETYRPPSVVALKRYVAPPKTVPFTRFNLFLRDRFTCQYCGEGFRANDLTFDHVVPRCFGGGTNWLNIVAACHPCNGKKCNKRLMKPLRMPYEPSAHELTAVKRTLPPNHLHQTWRDYLYWDVALERSGEAFAAEIAKSVL